MISAASLHQIKKHIFRKKNMLDISRRGKTRREISNKSRSGLTNPGRSAKKIQIEKECLSC
jgi:hypothetical protein